MIDEPVRLTPDRTGVRRGRAVMNFQDLQKGALHPETPTGNGDVPHRVDFGPSSIIQEK